MKAVFQTQVHEKNGDCQRAVIASLLELDPQQVPHFAMFQNPEWWWVMYYFLYALGWQLEGCMNPPLDGHFFDKLADCGIGGYHYVGVWSRTYPDAKPRVGHAVVMDGKGNVIHDPNPNQWWVGENLFAQTDLTAGALTVYLIRKRTDEKTNQEAPG